MKSRQICGLLGVGLFGLSSVLTACGAPSLNAVNVALKVEPTLDGFAFPNFGSNGTSEYFDNNDLALMFGEAACVGGVVDPCQPIAEAAAWAQMVNQARASGHCEGLAVQSAARFNVAAEPKTILLKKDIEVSHGIMRAFATQFLPDVQRDTNKWAKKSLVEKVNALSDSFRGASAESMGIFGLKPASALPKTGLAKFTIGVYTDAGGHALMPYAIEFPNENTVIIRVLDSNWPGQNRFIKIDLKTQTWEFSFSGKDPNNDPCVWRGKSGDLDLTALSTRVTATVPFGEGQSTVKNSLLVIRSKTRNWSITTSDGTYSPATGVAVDGISARSIRASSNIACGAPPLTEYTVQTDGDELELNFPDPAEVFVANDSSVTQLSTSGSSEKISVSKKKVSAGKNVKIKVASENKVISVDSDSSVVDISNDKLVGQVTTDAGQTITQTVDTQTTQAQIVVSDGSAVVTTLTATIVTEKTVAANGEETVRTNVTLSLNEVKSEPAVSALNVVKELPKDNQFDPNATTTTSSVVAASGDSASTSSVASAGVSSTLAPSDSSSSSLPSTSSSSSSSSSSSVTPSTISASTVVVRSSTTSSSTTSSSTTSSSTTTSTTTTSTLPPTTTSSSTTTTSSSTTTTTSTTTTSSTTTTTTPTTTTNPKTPGTFAGYLGGSCWDGSLQPYYWGNDGQARAGACPTRPTEAPTCTYSDGSRKDSC